MINTQEKFTIKSLNGCRIRVQRVNEQEYLCLTDLTPYINKKTSRQVKIIQKWLRRKATTEFLAEWERQNNPKFREVALNLKTLSITKWITDTKAIGIMANRGAYVAGTWAHIDIAIQFLGSLSTEIQVYTIEEFRRLEKQEAELLDYIGPERTIRHGLTKLDRLQTDDLEKSQMKSGNTAQNLYYVLRVQSKRI